MKRYILGLLTTALMLCMSVCVFSASGAGEGDVGHIRETPSGEFRDDVGDVGGEAPPGDTPPALQLVEGCWTGATVQSEAEGTPAACTLSVRLVDDTAYTVLEIADGASPYFCSFLLEKSDEGYAEGARGTVEPAAGTLALGTEGDLVFTCPDPFGEDGECVSLTFPQRAELPAAISPTGTFYTTTENGLYELDFDEEVLRLNGTRHAASFVGVGQYVVVCDMSDASGGPVAVMQRGDDFYMAKGFSRSALFAGRLTHEYTLTFSMGSCEGAAYAGDSALPAPLTAEFAGSYTVLLPAAPVWEGFAFLGWEIDGVLYAPGSACALRGDRTATATWEPVSAPPAPTTCNVSFDIGSHAAPGETALPQLGVSSGTQLRLPAPPAAAAGYAFGGWSDGEATYQGGTLYTVKGDVTLTAQWTATIYTVTFAENKPAHSHGTVQGDISPAAVSLDDAEFPLPALTLTGYALKGWRMGNVLLTGGTALFTEKDIPAAGTELVLTAEWEAISYLLRFDAAKPAEAKKEISGTAADIAVTLDDPQKTLPRGLLLEGYLLSGWKLNGRGTVMWEFLLTEEVIEEVGAPVIPFLAEWEKLPEARFAVTFDGGEGGSGVTDLPENTTAEAGEYPIPEQEPTRLGYNFLGWKVGDEPSLYKGGTDRATYTITDRSVHFTAQWAPVEYTLTFVGAEGATGIPASLAVTVESPAPDLSPARTGYRFLGWTWEGTAAPQAQFVLTPALIRQLGEGTEIALTLHWEAIGYRLVFEGGAYAGSGLPQARVVSLDAPTADLPEVPRAGYRFLGWTWTGVPEPRRDFLLTEELIGGLNGAEEVVLTAQWSAITYTIIYRENKPAHAGSAVRGGIDSAEVTLEDGEFPLPALTLTGYTFTGWQKGGATLAGSSSLFTERDIPAEGTELVLTAQWTAVVYTLHFLPKAGAKGSAEDIPVTLDDPAHDLPRLSLTGYTFLGWTLQEGTPQAAFTLTEALIGSCGADKTFVFTSAWRAIPYTILFEENKPVHSNGTVKGDMETAEASLDAAEFALPALTLTGYTLEGWETADGALLTGSRADLLADYLPASGTKVVLTAVWKAIPYTLNFADGEPAGADLPKAMSVTLDDPAVTPSAPVLTGYTFEGWTWTGSDDPCKTFTLTEALIEGMREETFTLVAHWHATVYHLVFVQGEPDGADRMPDPAEVTLVAPSVPLSAPVLANNIFVGWTWEGNDVPEKHTFLLTADLIRALEALEAGCTTFTLVAHWEKAPVHYLLKFYRENGCTQQVGTKDVYVVDGAALTEADLAIQPPTEKDYAFAGWRYRSGEGEVVVDTSFVPSVYGVEEFSFYAAWTFCVRIGTPGNALPYTAEPVYTEELSRGYCLTFKGTMTSAAEASRQTALLFVYSEELWGNFGMDGHINGDEVCDAQLQEYDTALLDGLNWTVERTSFPDEDTLLATIGTCDVTLVFDWTDASVIRVVFQAQGKDGTSVHTEYTIRATHDGFGQESYLVGIGGDRSYTVLEERVFGETPFVLPTVLSAHTACALPVRRREGEA